jgi:biopolymer transport protein ExbB
MSVLPLPQLAALLCVVVPLASFGGDLDELLSRVRQEGQTMIQIDQQREARFLSQREQQADPLARAKQQLEELENANRDLRNQYRDNQQMLSDLEQTLDERSSDLQMTFQAARQSGAELADILSGSLVSAQFPNRAQALQPLLQGSGPLALKDLKALWHLLLQEMVESGKVTRFQGQVVARDGVNHRADLTRIGTFTLGQDGRFLRFDGNRLFELARQPSSNLQQIAKAFAASRGDLNPAVVDPGRGAALEILGQTPDLWQRVRQGGLIGYLILGLGSLGLMIGVWRLLDTALISRRMRRQLNDPERPSPDNPLGRVLLAGQRLREQDPAHLELHLQEAALREIPRLTLAQSFLKLMAAVSPLLGLLGTVTGMILTFQAITLAGAANSSLMAEGIGQALVTTVLGLTVAIPILFLHNLLASRSRSLIQILDQETAGLIVQATRESGVQ